MRVVVIGSGGREHALAWRLARSPSVSKLQIWPGNGGTEQAGWHLDPQQIVADDPVATLLGLQPDLVVVGPEAPLVEGLADALRQGGIAVFGPGADGARLEGSKIFAKEFMERHGIPTARGLQVERAENLAGALAELGDEAVLKADGLAAGKGVLLSSSREQALASGRAMLDGSAFGDAGRRLLVEERLAGYEVSLMAVCDGKDFFLLPPSQDHKRAQEGDRGPNTGGMGAYSPVPVADSPQFEELGRRIFAASLAGLAAEGIDYRGALYAGVMMTPAGPRVLEYNCRFGDPETQVLLPRLAGDFGELLFSAATGGLNAQCVSIRDECALTVVLASAGYPGAYETGFAIAGLDSPPGDGEEESTIVFHAGTRFAGGKIVTSGGRVLAVTGLGHDLPQSADRCYRRIDTISFTGRTFRRDIGWRVLSRGGMA